MFMEKGKETVASFVLFRYDYCRLVYVIDICEDGTG